MIVSRPSGAPSARWITVRQPPPRMSDTSWNRRRYQRLWSGMSCSAFVYEEQACGGSPAAWAGRGRETYDWRIFPRGPGSPLSPSREDPGLVHLRSYMSRINRVSVMR